MKRIAIFLILLFIPLCAAAEEETPRVEALAVYAGCATAYNGAEYVSTAPPLIARDKVYIDIFAAAPHLGINAVWTDGERGCCTLSRGSVTCDFYNAQCYDDCNYGGIFFTKDGVIYIAINDLINAFGLCTSYDGDIITLSWNHCTLKPDKEKLGEALDAKADEYLYRNYYYAPRRIVDPYCTYTYASMINDCAALHTMYPDLIRVSSIGTSTQGRDIPLIEFGRGEKKIFVCATHHAKEYIATTYVMYAIDTYAYAYRTDSAYYGYNMRNILDNVTFCIVPMVNPDGVTLVQKGISEVKDRAHLASIPTGSDASLGYKAWKANINGVDLNWNYDCRLKHGGISYPCGRNYYGEFPASECETRAMSDYMCKNEFEAFLSLHTQGEVYYWNEAANRTTGLNVLIQNATGFKCAGSGTSDCGGSWFDFVVQKFGKATMTIELCPYVGVMPYPDGDFDTVWRSANTVLPIWGSQNWQ